MGPFARAVTHAGLGFALVEVGLALLGGETVGGGSAERLLEGRDVEEPGSHRVVVVRGHDAFAVGAPHGGAERHLVALEDEGGARTIRIAGGERRSQVAGLDGATIDPVPERVTT